MRIPVGIIIRLDNDNYTRTMIKSLSSAYQSSFLDLCFFQQVAFEHIRDLYVVKIL